MTKLIKSFGFAMSGISAVWREEVNFRIESVIALLVVGGGIYLGFTKLEWAFVLVCIGAVLSSEILNTAVEDTCNKIEPSMDPVIGKIKDMMAGFVFVVSVVSVAIGVMVFTNHL
ncbi:MAG: diacylglycerol kinase family protein [bacterium]|nr:diacylglycerol kinase family protein [bacterium]